MKKTDSIFNAPPRTGRHPDADRHADAWRSDCERADANTQDVGNSIKKPHIALR